MADAVTITPEQLEQERQTHMAKLASVGPNIIIDRLTRVHGFTINTEEEANAVVKAAVDLFYMHQDGLIEALPSPVETSDNPLVKAAKEVSKVNDEIRAKQAGDNRLFDYVLNNQELMKSARELVRLSETPAAA
jgi:hypothetical protein